MVSSTDSVKEPWRGHHQGYVWIAVFIVLVSLATTGVVSAATQITGPTTISAPGEYVLANDIVNSDADACIIINAPNVVLNGAGHKIDGVDKLSSIGIWVYNSGMTLFNVVIKNIVVTDWGVGIITRDMRNSQIDKATVSSNINSGLALQNSMRNMVTNNIIDQNGAAGIVLYETSDSNTLSGNTVTGNGMDGIRIRFSSNNDLINNKILNNKVAGIKLDNGHFNSVTGNTLTGNKDTAINLYQSNANLITKNTIRDNNYGIWINVDSYNNDISQNTVTNNSGNAITLVNNANTNMVFGNTFEKSTDAGIWLYNNKYNTIYNNLVKNNVNEGIWMRDSSSNVIVNNYFYNDKNSVLIAGLSANKWNLTQSAQKSITGGANSGGNSWGQPNGLGFSQVTPATNGICNQPYTLAANNVDKLPLKWAKK
jgi:parallel beta-helix repeat protein